MYSEQIIGESGVPKNAKVADILYNSRWSPPAAANQDLQEILECIRAIRPLNSEQEDTVMLYGCRITQVFFQIKRLEVNQT